MKLTDAKCAHCGKQLGDLREIPMEYAGKHWHISCLLDTLPLSDFRPTDKPHTPTSGAGFHP